MSFSTYALTAPSRLGDDGYGLHDLYFRNIANAVAKSDSYKRSRIITSQTVGAYVPAGQMRQIYSDKFYSTYELMPTKCLWRDRNPCKWSPLRNHYYDPMFSAEDFSRRSDD